MTKGGIALGVAVLAVIQCSFIGAVCKALADIVPLLKKSNGIQFAGKISQAKIFQQVNNECSACGYEVFRADARVCGRCGGEFDTTAK
jgi:hypothetical protein